MDSPVSSLLHKQQFASAARAFVKHARRTPAFPMLELVCLAAGFLAVISGAFRTDELPVGQRGAFWLLLMLWSALKWRLWFASMVHGRADWRRASIIGAVLLNLPLPLEISIAMRVVGVEAEIGRSLIWIKALAISGIVFALSWTLRRLFARREVPLASVASGPLIRAGIRLDQIGAVRGEDHYCRVFLADGSTRLVLCRLRDALAELADRPGERIHRSAWLADWAVERARREGRGWRIVAVGQLFAVSAANVKAARRRGWLSRR
jgi:hypothetical protein